MPIQFRCSHCRQLLSISTKRAGSKIVCPACTTEILVPSVGDAAAAAPAATSPKPAAPSTKPAVTPPPPPPPPETVARKPAGMPALPETAQEFSVSRRSDPPKPPEVPAPPAATAQLPTRSRPGRSAYSTATTYPRNPLLEEDGEEEEHEHTPHKKKRFMDDTVDMTAMVDVTFLLLIFFMVTASFAAQKVFETSAPEQEAEGSGGGAAVVNAVEDVESNSVLVEIDGSDRIEIEGQPVSSLFQLREVLASKIASDGKTDLLIQAQYEATHGTVVSVTDVAMDAGMQNVRRISRKVDE